MCSSFLPAAVIKSYDQKQFGRERGICGVLFQVTAHHEGKSEKEFSKSSKADTMEEGCLLTPLGSGFASFFIQLRAPA